MKVNNHVKQSILKSAHNISPAAMVRNRCKIFLEDAQTEEMVAESCVESKTKEINESKKDINQVSESCDVEAITVDTLEILLREIDAECSKTITGQAK